MDDGGMSATDEAPRSAEDAELRIIPGVTADVEYGVVAPGLEDARTS
jgi:hypothetical protein